MDIFALFDKIGKSEPAGGGPPAFLIAGLGNPGEKYAQTRHNAGFMAMDVMAQQLGISLKTLKFKSLTASAVVGGKPVLLMKPQTFMNASGQAVREAAQFYKLPPERVLILVDDVCLAPGRMRIRKSGSDGGQRGLKDIIYQLASDQFPRIRFGVGEKPSKDYDMADWVLGKVPKADQEPLFRCLEKALPACALIVNGRLDEAMGQWNGFSAVSTDHAKRADSRNGKEGA